MPEDVTDSEVELLDQAFAELREFAGEIQNRKTDSAWFANLLVCILHAAWAEYRHLRLALRTSTALLSWSCRNLLELNIYVQHALMSEANARRFVADGLIDGVDILSSFKTWLARNDPDLALPALDDALGSMIELRAQQDGASKARALRGLAAEVGLADEYANMNALCAKLSRPTAYSVLAVNGEKELLLLRPTLFRAGAGHGLEIYQTVKGHVDAFDAEPKP